jgi:DNA repair protein RecO (recombination protein O)
MPGLYRDEGVVLRAIKLGEADRIVTVFTQGHGKIRAVAKGIRKTTSKFGARLEPMSRVALQCYKGRELDIVTQAETLDANRTLREEYSLLTHAVPMLEAVDQVVQDREPNPAVYRMLTGALHALGVTRNPLVTPAFFWKLLSLEGFHPMLDACARCGEAPDPADADPGAEGDEAGAGAGGPERELVAFDLLEGGTVCRACARGGGHPITPEGLALLRRVLGGGLNGALNETPGPAAHEVEQLGIRALEHHVERRMRSTVLL